MKDSFVSIFNDVIGPVMRGPSSSHTAGAYRIATLVRSLCGGLPEMVQCAFDPKGSYAPTYRPLGVDKAFCAGLIGLDMLDPSYESAVAQAESQTAVSFTVEPLERADHPNAIRVRVRGERNLTIWARSTGGGVVDLYYIDGFQRANDGGAPLSISGKERAAVVLLPADIPARAAVAEAVHAGGPLTPLPVGAAEQSGTSRAPAVQVFIDDGGIELLERLKREWGADYLLAEPVFYPRATRDAGAISSTAEILDLTDASGLSLGEAALAFEARLLGMSEQDTFAEMERRFEIMRSSVATGYDESRTSLAWLSPHARGMKSAFDGGTLPYGSYHTLAAIRAHAVMHTCNSRGVVCAAPTGGSAGVLPGVLLTLEEELGYSRDRVVKALFAAGLVGVLFAQRATFAAESAGCQVEIGAAGAMAAAAAVDIAGGSAKAALDAAAVSLQNTMGSICDPVGGGCEIPCHTRNGVAASAAFVTADMIFAGYQNPIPLNETIDASYDVGTRLHSDFRCTALGGIAVTPSALRLAGRNR